MINNKQKANKKLSKILKTLDNCSKFEIETVLNVITTYQENLLLRQFLSEIGGYPIRLKESF